MKCPFRKIIVETETHCYEDFRDCDKDCVFYEDGRCLIRDSLIAIVSKSITVNIPHLPTSGY